MSEEDKDYVVSARTHLDSDFVQSIVKAPNLQEALRKSIKLVPPRAGYSFITIDEVVSSRA